MEQIADLFSAEEKVPGEYEAALEKASQRLVEAYQNDQVKPFQDLLDDLILLSKPPKGPAGEQSRWLLKKSAVDAEVGQTLIYQKQAEAPQELLLSLDAKGNWYLGSWRSLEQDGQKPGFLFHLETSEGGNHLVIDDGQNKKSHELDNLPGLEGWASLAGFLEGLKAREPRQDRTAVAGPAAAQPAPIPAPQPDLPAVEAPAPGPQARPLPATILAKAPTWQVLVQPGGQALALTASLSIGREPDNGLCLGDNKLSRHHAVIEAVSGGWQVRDLGSTNGTGVNGKRISAPLVLKAGDVIELGDTRLTLELR